MKIQRIFLLRHGESEGNVNREIYKTIPDHAIPLSETGRVQARGSAHQFLAYLKESQKGSIGRIRHLSVWTSPYLRTRQTTSEFMSVAKAGFTAYDIQENVMLCEQQFGLFDGIPEEELPVKFPEEHKHYKKCEDFEGRFWARMPLGESRFDVAVRIHQMFGTLQRDAKDQERNNLLIVSHGVALRAFVMQWLRLPFEWLDSEPNPKNCSVRLIEANRVSGYEDKGYIVPGY